MLPVDPTFNCQYAPNGPALLKTIPTPPEFVDPSEWTQLISQTAQRTLTSLPLGTSPQQIVSPYLKYELRTRYHWNNGTLKLPVAETPASLPILKGFTTQSSGSAILQTPAPSGDGGSVIKTFAPQYGDNPDQPVSGQGTLIRPSDITARPAAKIIQVHAPTGTKVITFVIIRLGLQPELPDPTPRNDNETLETADTDIYAPTPIADGNTFVWAAAGTYVYHLTQPYWASDGFVGGSTPADRSALEGNYVPPTQYDSEIA